MQFSKSFFLVSAFGVFQLFTSCKDEPTKLGLDLLPGKDRIALITCDTIPVGSSIYDFSKEPMRNSDTVMLGSINDPVFGKFTASLLTEFRPEQTIPILAVKTADSLVIRFKSTKYVGGKNSKVKLKVYRMRDTLSIYSSYQSNMDVSKYVDFSQLVAETEIDFSQPVIKFQLSKSFAQELISKTNDSARFFNDTTYHNLKIGGLYFQTQTETSDTGTVATFNMLNSDTVTGSTFINDNNMVLYYNDSLVLEFGFSSYIFNYNSSGTAIHRPFYSKVNLFQHDYSNTTFKSEPGLGSGKPDSVLHLLSAGGIINKLNLVKLQELKQKKWTINVSKAEIIIPYDSTFFIKANSIHSAIPFTQVLRLGVVELDSTIYLFSSKFLPFSDSYVDGSTYPTEKSYKINITQYIQEYLDGRTSENELVLIPNNCAFDLNGTILKRNKNIKLRITYSKF
jgi:hypothetical protein